MAHESFNHNEAWLEGLAEKEKPYTLDHIVWHAVAKPPRRSSLQSVFLGERRARRSASNQFVIVSLVLLLPGLDDSIRASLIQAVAREQAKCCAAPWDIHSHCSALMPVSESPRPLAPHTLSIRHRAGAF
ncbi:unnamed protein product [Arctogadus glacialis]